MVTDQEIAESLDSLFRETNPNSFTSFNDVVLRLQSRLGYDLSHKIDFIRAQISLFFGSPLPPPPPPNQPLQHQHQHQNQHQNQHQHQHQHQHQLPLSQTAAAAAAAPQIPVFRGSPAVAAHYQVHHSYAVPRHVTEINFAQPVPKQHESAVAKNVPAPEAPVKESAQSKPKRKGGTGGLNKLCNVSPLLQAVVGQPAMPRTEIVKQLWAYIRKNNLQDPSNKRKIICNDELRLVFETDSTDMFQMNKLLSKHISPLDPPKESGQQSKKLKTEEESEAKSTESDPVVISEALANFFGATGREMLQSEVTKRLSEYIKVHDLEDSLNSMVVCDSKLQELFGCESMPAAGIYDVLARDHLLHRS